MLHTPRRSDLSQARMRSGPSRSDCHTEPRMRSGEGLTPSGAMQATPWHTAEESQALLPTQGRDCSPRNPYTRRNPPHPTANTFHSASMITHRQR